MASNVASPSMCGCATTPGTPWTMCGGRMIPLEPTSAIVSEADPYWSANGGASSPFCGLIHRETVFDSEVSDDVTNESDYEDNRDVEEEDADSDGDSEVADDVTDESDYEDNRDVEEDADSDGDCVAREEVLSELSSTCNTKKNVRPKVRAKKDVSSGSAIVEALSAKVTLLYILGVMSLYIH